MRVEKASNLLPRAVVEQIEMIALGKEFDPLRLVGGLVDPLTHFHRDHRVLLAMQDQNRGRNRANVVLDVVFVGNEPSSGNQK